MAGNYTIFQLTDNDYFDYEPKIKGDKIVWSGSNGKDNEIFLYDGSQIIQLTDNSYSVGIR